MYGPWEQQGELELEEAQLFSPDVMSLMNDAAPAYKAGLTNPTGGKPAGKGNKIRCRGGKIRGRSLSEVRRRSDVRKV